LLAVDWHLNPVTHLVLVGDAHDENVQAMHRMALAGFIPRRIVQRVAPQDADRQPLPQAVRGMLAAGQSPRGYACTGASCLQPAGDVATWQATLESLRSVAA
jgi:uncharacterized protein YyaL (SSP411 family)